MARKPDIQYIRYYTDGSAARQLEHKTPGKKKSSLPKPRRQKKQVFYVDPLALGGIVLAAVMLVLMTVGCVQLFNAQRQQQQMRDYVDYLEQQNAQLSAAYDEGVDLEEIEQSALALGMIPAEAAQQITISVPVTEPEAEPNFWEQVTAFFAGLFA